MAYARIRPRRGTAYEWSTYNPVLESGELGLEYPDTGLGTGLCKLKVGNGSSRWNDLEYAFDGTAASAFDGGTVTNFHILQIRAGSSESWANSDPVINDRELIYVTDKGGFKVGNGVDVWSDLPYTNTAGFVDNMIDFGDEDAEDEIVGIDLVKRLDNVDQYIDNNEDEAGIDDLIDNPEENTDETPEEP